MSVDGNLVVVIDNTGSSALGTKADFEKMCATAESYGIDVIVDIVANHMANYKVADNQVDANRLSDEVKTYEPEIFNNYSAYFHSERYDASDSSAEMMTRGHVSSCPDLNTGNSYGYKACKSEAHFRESVDKLYREKVIPAAKKGLCAAIITQVSDVEDEINGLLTYDRKICKLTPETMVPVAEALQAELEK